MQFLYPLNILTSTASQEKHASKVNNVHIRISAQQLPPRHMLPDLSLELSLIHYATNSFNLIQKHCITN